MKEDWAISRKSITESNWTLIFTRLGKYFFFNPQNGERAWLPPTDVLETLKRNYGGSSNRQKMEMLFDPFYEGEVEESVETEGESGESESEPKDDSVHSDIAHSDNAHSDIAQSNPSTRNSHINDQSDAEDQFKLYLLKNQVDPFAPWPKILSAHSSSPEFSSVPSDKRRQDLFAQVCPLLIEQRRELNRKQLQEAKDWWEEVKQDNWRNNCPWFQVLKKIKGNPKFSLLNEKECEKEYKKNKK